MIVKVWNVLIHILLIVILVRVIISLWRKQWDNLIKYAIILVILLSYTVSIHISWNIYWGCKELQATVRNPEPIYESEYKNIQQIKEHFYSKYLVDSQFIWFTPKLRFSIIEDSSQRWLYVYCDGYDFDDDGGLAISLSNWQTVVPFPFINGDIIIGKIPLNHEKYKVLKR